MESVKRPREWGTNHVLAALPDDEYGRFAVHLKPVALTRGQVLCRPHEPVTDGYFPHHGVVSMMALMQDGDTVEVGMVGREGMIGMPAVLGARDSPVQFQVQVGDGGSRVSARALQDEFDRGGALERVLLRYAHLRMSQLSQTAACNRLHGIHERLCRWLLMCRDRSSGDELALTHHLVSTMLGAQRAGVSLALASLEQAGLIRRQRGSIVVQDRAGLELAACECYAVIRAEEEQYFADIARHPRGLPGAWARRPRA